MKPFCARSLSEVVDDGLEGVVELLSLHDLFIKLSFFFLVSVEFIFESFDILGYIAKVSKSNNGRGVVGKGLVDFVD
jgi:hypothetical protein